MQRSLNVMEGKESCEELQEWQQGSCTLGKDEDFHTFSLYR